MCVTGAYEAMHFQCLCCLIRTDLTGYVFIELKHVTATVSLMVPAQTQGKATL